MKTNTNLFKRACYAYLIDCINDDEAEGMTPAEKVQHVERRIRAELPHVVERKGFDAACVDFLSGLGIGIDYTYVYILAAAAEMHGGISVWGISEKEADKIVDNWFPFMGYQLAQLCRYVASGKRDLLPSQPVTA